MHRLEYPPQVEGKHVSRDLSNNGAVHSVTANAGTHFESSTSTLGNHSAGQPGSRGEPHSRPAHSREPNGFTDFFSQEVFQIVLHNPTTAHRFMKFCESRACPENIEFLQKVSVKSKGRLAGTASMGLLSYVMPAFMVFLYIKERKASCVFAPNVLYLHYCYGGFVAFSLPCS
jgi:hypothetical protein